MNAAENLASTFTHGNSYELVGPNTVAAVSVGSVIVGVGSVFPRATHLGKVENAGGRDTQATNRYFRFTATRGTVVAIDRKSRSDDDAAK
tara:strand:+ start:980 stop:1249 length:270 start_codon:yes stop_codon:yes gene_type:complete